jgi:hypothetical protein
MLVFCSLSALCKLFYAIQESSPQRATSPTEFAAVIRQFIPKPTDPRWLRFYCYHIKTILANILPERLFAAVESPVALAKALLDTPSLVPAEPSFQNVVVRVDDAATPARQEGASRSEANSLIAQRLPPATKPSRSTRNIKRKQVDPNLQTHHDDDVPKEQTANSSSRRLPALWIHDDAVLVCAFCSSAYDREHIPQWLECHRRHVLSEELAVMREHARNLLRLRSLVASSRVRAVAETLLLPANASTAETLSRNVNAAIKTNPNAIS